MAKGDKVRVLVDVGAVEAREFVIEATKAGRIVDVGNPRAGMIEISECTRTGQVIKVDRFMVSRVVALVEEKTDTSEITPPATGPQQEGML